MHGHKKQKLCATRFALMKLDLFCSPGVEHNVDQRNYDSWAFITNMILTQVHPAFHGHPPPAGSDNKIYNASVTKCTSKKKKEKKSGLSSTKCTVVIIRFTLGMQEYKSRVIVKCLHSVWAPAFLLQPSRRTLLCNCDRFNAVAKASGAYGFIRVYESLCSQLDLLV